MSAISLSPEKESIFTASASLLPVLIQNSLSRQDLPLSEKQLDDLTIQSVQLAYKLRETVEVIEYRRAS